ncbi:MAG: hypothetical protein OXC06_02680 [Acidimicrobiaceae bacterium]|nr:hypothetical protein [Acidimicrobiaceae bacterium]
MSLSCCQALLDGHGRRFGGRGSAWAAVSVLGGAGGRAMLDGARGGDGLSG